MVAPRSSTTDRRAWSATPPRSPGGRSLQHAQQNRAIAIKAPVLLAEIATSAALLDGVDRCRIDEVLRYCAAPRWVTHADGDVGMDDARDRQRRMPVRLDQPAVAEQQPGVRMPGQHRGAE
jgi:hypothetical protein